MKKNLQNWLNEGRIQQHNTSVKEIADLLKVVDRDLADAAIKKTSADRRFATAYKAAGTFVPARAVNPMAAISRRDRSHTLNLSTFSSFLS